MTPAVQKLLASVVAAFLTISVGWLLRLPTEVALLQSASAVHGDQLDEVIALINAMHPRTSAHAGGPPEWETDAERRDAQIRELMRRAPAVDDDDSDTADDDADTGGDDDDDSAELECPPCRCQETK